MMAAALRAPAHVAWCLGWPVAALTVSREVARRVEPRGVPRWFGVTLTVLVLVGIDVCNVALWWPPFARVSPW